MQLDINGDAADEPIATKAYAEEKTNKRAQKQKRY